MLNALRRTQVGHVRQIGFCMRLIGLPPHRRAGALIVGARHALSETVVRIDDDVFITLKNVTRESDPAAPRLQRQECVFARRPCQTIPIRPKVIMRCTQGIGVLQ